MEGQGRTRHTLASELRRRDVQVRSRAEILPEGNRSLARSEVIHARDQEGDMFTLKAALEAAGFWTLPPRRRPWCDGKTQHETMGQAQAAVRSLLRRELAKDTATIHAYQCPTCLKFHTGHHRSVQRVEA